MYYPDLSFYPSEGKAVVGGYLRLSVGWLAANHILKEMFPLLLRIICGFFAAIRFCICWAITNAHFVVTQLLVSLNKMDQKNSDLVRQKSEC